MQKAAVRPALQMKISKLHQGQGKKAAGRNLFNSFGQDKRVSRVPEVNLPLNMKGVEANRIHRPLGIFCHARIFFQACASVSTRLFYSVTLDSSSRISAQQRLKYIGCAQHINYQGGQQIKWFNKTKHQGENQMQNKNKE